MTACTACGHEPVRGNFCPACGSAVGTASSAPPPPPPGSAPQPQRFPMYADEPPEPPATSGGTHAAPRPSAGPLPWVIGVGFVLLLVIVGGILVMAGGGGDDDLVTDPATKIGAPKQPDAASAKGSGDGDTSADEDAVDPPGDRAPLTPAEVDVPGSAPDSRDNQGNTVSFDEENLFDDDTESSWRVAGDASGETLTFTFDEPVVLTEVGLINGYAKNDPPNDWYLANRRVVEVEWVLDGTTVSQTLAAEDRSLQTQTIDPVETSTVELRIVSVSSAGSRDYTAISEVLLSGG